MYKKHILHILPAGVILASVADPDPYGSALFLEAGSGSALISKFRSLEVQNGAVEGRGHPQSIKIEFWRVCRLALP